MLLEFERVDEILKCDPSNESYSAVLCCSAVYYAAQGGLRMNKINCTVLFCGTVYHVMY